jgi:hypothetical protein
MNALSNRDSFSDTSLSLDAVFVLPPLPARLPGDAWLPYLDGL